AILIMITLVGCAPSAASVETAIAQTQVAQPTLTSTKAVTATQTIEPSPSYTPRPTATPLPSDTPRPTPTTGPSPTATTASSATSEGPVGKFALNHLATAESGGLKFEVARAAFFTRAAMIDLDGTNGIVSDPSFKDIPLFGELILKVTNTTDKKLSIYPDQ